MDGKCRKLIRGGGHGWSALLLPLFLILFLLNCWAEAAKRQPAVTAWFSPENTAVRLGDRVDLTLHLLALAPAPQVEVRFLIPPQVRAVSGSAPWFGTLAQNATIDLPLTVEIAQEGEYSIGATVKSGAETAGATLNVVATAQGVQLSTDPIFLLKLRNAQSPSERQKLLDRPASPGIVPPSKPPTPAEERLNRYFLDQIQNRPASPSGGDTSPRSVAATTVTGTLTYKDTAGAAHPIRYALVQILDGATDALLPGGETLILSDGSYSASVSAASVKVRVLSGDGLRAFVRVNPLGAPDSRYAYTSAATTVTGPTTTISFSTDQPVRGAPGAPSTDVMAARAFSVFDALMQYQVQAYGLRGAFMAQTKANFPNSAGSPCPAISCYSPSAQEMYILREDALDWDVIGHEFFHYVTNQGAARSIDNNPGGSHSGGSAIGQIPGPGLPPRNRDQGMRLAWSEGFATFMSIRLQNEPTSTDFGMTWANVPNVGDTHYQDTEDSTIDEDIEDPGNMDGFGSENSVMAMLWDFADTPSDSSPPGGPGQATDKFDLSPKILWDLVNSGLPCDPCDRVDRFWNAVFSAVGAGPTLVDVAETLAMSKIGPELTDPIHGVILTGETSPTFTWQPNGDPQPAHKPNRFHLAISKNRFLSDIHLSPSQQPLQGTQYQIPREEFLDLLRNVSVLSTGYVNMGGTWHASETATVACTIDGVTEIETTTGSETLSIQQNGPSLRWSIMGVDRAGTVLGDRAQVSGIFMLPEEGVTFSQNTYTAQGIISELTWAVIGFREKEETEIRVPDPGGVLVSNVRRTSRRIDWTGSGNAAGTYCDEFGCASFSCLTMEDAAIMTPLSPQVVPKPTAGQMLNRVPASLLAKIRRQHRVPSR